MHWYTWVGLALIAAVVIWAEHKIAATPAKTEECKDDTDSCGC